jgi:hypothetical protein
MVVRVGLLVVLVVIKVVIIVVFWFNLDIF